MKKRYVNLILAMVSASAMALGSVPAMAATDSAKTESAKNDSKEDAEASNEKEADAAKTDTLEDGVYTAEYCESLSGKCRRCTEGWRRDH